MGLATIEGLETATESVETMGQRLTTELRAELHRTELQLSHWVAEREQRLGDMQSPMDHCKRRRGVIVVYLPVPDELLTGSRGCPANAPTSPASSPKADFEETMEARATEVLELRKAKQEAIAREAHYTAVAKEQEHQLQEQVKRLEELRVTEKEELPAKLEVLEAERSCAAEELEAKKKEMANRRYMKDEELSSLGRGVLLYSRLGLEFEGGEAGQDGVTKCLRLVFRQISRNDPERPFVVAVRIDEAGQYDVPECIPVLPVEDFKRMVNDLNETNNFASFVSGVRRAFVSLAQAGL